MATERRTDIGPPHYSRFLPPIIKENYGKWKYHEIPKPGVLMHVGESGDKLFSVRAARVCANSSAIEAYRLMTMPRPRWALGTRSKYSGFHGPV